MDLNFAGFGPPESSELRPINLSFDDSIDQTSEELGGPKSSELRLTGLSSEKRARF